MNYLDQVKHTYIENWPSSLVRLSMAQVDVPLTLAEARAVGFHIIEFGEGFVPFTEQQQAQKSAAYAWTHRSMLAIKTKVDPGPRVDMPDVTPTPEWIAEQKALLSVVRQRLVDALAKFPKGAVIRLGSRSPKDVWSWMNDPKLMAGQDPLTHILNCSERIYEDLSLALISGYEPHVFVREWIDIPEWAEFRCFLRGGKLAGVSQYNYHHEYAEIAEQVDTIAYWLKYYVNDFFIPACPFPDIVFDVAVFLKKTVQPSGLTAVAVECKLIEINPFFEMTDPCLFDWRGGGDFGGTLRYKGVDKKVVSVQLN